MVGIILLKIADHPFRADYVNALGGIEENIIAFARGFRSRPTSLPVCVSSTTKLGVFRVIVKSRWSSSFSAMA